MLACVYGTYLIVGLNCYRVACYGSICMGIHIWKYLSYILHISLWVWAEMKFYVGTLTTKRVAQLVTLYMRERVYATVSTIRNKFFLSL